jgi:hypothetical protein
MYGYVGEWGCIIKGLRLDYGGMVGGGIDMGGCFVEGWLLWFEGGCGSFNGVGV